MKIEFGTDTLGDDSTGDFITPALGRSHSRQVQVTALAGGASPFVTPRGNATNRISFVVEKQHADAKTAALYVCTHPDSLAGQAVLRISEGSNAAQIADACLESCDLASLTGRATAFHYTFTGGPMTEST